jgi:hypothetical protein
MNISANLKFKFELNIGLKSWDPLFFYAKKTRSQKYHATAPLMKQLSTFRVLIIYVMN